MIYKIGDKVEFFTKNETIYHGEIFRIKKFPKIYFVKTDNFIYKIKEKNIIRRY